MQLKKKSVTPSPFLVFDGQVLPFINFYIDPKVNDTAISNIPNSVENLKGGYKAAGDSGTLQEIHTNDIMASEEGDWWE